MISLFNSHLSPVDIIVVILNILGASAGGYWSLRASHAGLMAKTSLMVTPLALIYVVSYSYLLFSDVAPATWSSSLRMVALLAWYFVWVLPPMKALETRHLMTEKLEKEVLRRMGIDDTKDGNEQ